MKPGNGRPPAAWLAISESVQARAGRVDEIRRSISAGSYDVPAADVAAALIAFFNRDLAPDDDGNAGFAENSC